MKTIPNKCYIVANMPDAVADWVINLRKKVDPALAHRPVEITLSGSSGVGPLIEGQNFERVKTTLMGCLSTIVPFDFSFRAMSRFPTAEIYFLEPEPEVFNLIHKKLVESELKFADHKFPYTPHCSVAGFTPVTEETRSIITSVGFPKGTHSVSSISIYRNENMTPVELWRYEPTESESA